MITRNQHRKNEFDANRGGGLMRVGPFAVELNLPEAIEDSGDGLHGLPPYSPRRSFLVDELVLAPKPWIRSEVVDGVQWMSYMVPVVAGRGLWLDLNPCASLQRHVAALVSIQGVNAVSGRKLKGDGDSRLEQHAERCPEHDVPFQAERYCPECKFKWPRQNYLASCAQPHGAFWLDGFRAQDGVVRQFVFTEEEMRGVAAAILGRDRCWALGIALYESVEDKPRPAGGGILRGMGMTNGWSGGGCTGQMIGGSADDDGTVLMGFESSVSYCASDQPASVYLCGLGDAGATKGMGGQQVNSTRSLSPMRRVEVAAGARIDQRVHDDPNPIGFWREKPSGVIVINYVSEETAREILAGPRVDVTGGGEGFLGKAGVPVGNPAK